ncbi:hypothetical protein BC937DRAFT_86873 [Endogone sp. FLAS-F59071]|nr:hypothetical protein BC937DRAFT_86873 [Endogone sp. FLAS-F59071]|eukprot:RUS12854.1 hypothetical protein BC937DRAFT_86873 [Endogone sp. FLAS-F59071]
MKIQHSTACYYCTTGLLAVVMLGMPAAVHAQSNPNAGPLDLCSADGAIQDYNYPLHVASVFIIMGASGLGAFIPVLAVRYPALRIPDWLITLGEFRMDSFVQALLVWGGKSCS